MKAYPAKLDSSLMVNLHYKIHFAYFKHATGESILSKNI